MANYRQMLREVAVEQYGYVTSRRAGEIGLPAAELPKLAARGGLTHIARGLYRFDDVPVTPLDQFMEATLLAGPGAVLAGDAVLAMYELALVNPRRITVVTPHRVRAKLPIWLKLEQRDLDAADLTNFEGIPSTTVLAALRECEGYVMRERLRDAVREARRRGWLTEREAASERARLRAMA